MIVNVDAAKLRADPDFHRLAHVFDQIPGVAEVSGCAQSGSYFLLGGNLATHQISARGWALGTWTRDEFARCSQQPAYQKLMTTMGMKLRFDGDRIVSTTSDLNQSTTWVEDRAMFTSASIDPPPTREDLLALATPRADTGPMTVPLTRELIGRVRGAPLWAVGREGFAIAIEPHGDIVVRVIAKGDGIKTVQTMIELFDLHPKRNGDEFRATIPRAKLRELLGG
jgi:hypothetical protein